MVYKFLSRLEAIVNGLRCLGCGARSGLEALCSGCEALVEEAIGCDRCGGAACGKNKLHRCGCERIWLPYRCCLAAVVYAPPAVDVVLALKRYGSYRSLRFCTEKIVQSLSSNPLTCRGVFSLVTWVPAASAERKGFDHGEMLAASVGRELGIASKRLLTRRNGAEMKELGAIGRMATAPSCFIAAERSRKYASVLLVDDVTTTGASLHYASLALKRSGVQDVYAVAVARTSLGAVGKASLSFSRSSRYSEPMLRARQN